MYGVKTRTVSGNVWYKVWHVYLLSGIIWRGDGTEPGLVGVGKWFTFSTNTDFEHSGAKTISSWHTESLISGVFFGTHEDITGGCKSVCLNAFYLHVFHITKVDRPETE